MPILSFLRVSFIGIVYCPSNTTDCVYMHPNLGANQGGSVSTFAIHGGVGPSLGDFWKYHDASDRSPAIAGDVPEGVLRPTPQYILGNDRARCLGSAFRIRFMFSAIQSVTLRHMVVSDPADTVGNEYNRLIGSDYATTIAVEPRKWYTVRPELSRPHLQKEFQAQVLSLGSFTNPFFPIILAFTNVVSPDPLYAGKFVVEIQALCSVEHVLSDDLKNFGTKGNKNGKPHEGKSETKAGGKNGKQ